MSKKPWRQTDILLPFPEFWPRSSTNVSKQPLTKKALPGKLFLSLALFLKDSQISHLQETRNIIWIPNGYTVRFEGNLTGTNFASYHFGSHSIADMNELCSISLYGLQNVFSDSAPTCSHCHLLWTQLHGGHEALRSPGLSNSNVYRRAFGHSKNRKERNPEELPEIANGNDP